jgi:hypothetical protein
VNYTLTKTGYNMKQVIDAFLQLNAEERIKAYAAIREAVAHDADLHSAGKDPGTAHWEALLSPPEEPAPSKAKTISEKSVKKG